MRLASTSRKTDPPRRCDGVLGAALQRIGGLRDLRARPGTSAAPRASASAVLLDGNRRGSTPGRDRVVGTRETTRCSACTDALEVPPAAEDSTAGTVDPTISIETMRFHPLGELACIQLARLFHLHQASPVRSGPPLLVSRTTAVPRVEVRRRSRRAEHARFLDLVLSLLGASRASAVVPPDNYLGPWIPLLVLEVDPSTAARDTSCERGSRKGAVMYLEHGEPQLISAFLDSISDGGVKEMSVDDVARRLGSSRSALYRQFGSWSQMITFGYAAMLEHLDSYVPRPRDDRATEFEAWWSALTDLLGSVKGVGILAMRSLAELHVGSERLEEFEARQLVSLVQWCATSPAALRATWSLVRAASARKLSAQERLELREIVWLMVGGQLKPGAGEAMEALSEPLH